MTHGHMEKFYQDGIRDTGQATQSTPEIPCEYCARPTASRATFGNETIPLCGTPACRKFADKEYQNLSPSK
jgi:hypothetical protein